MPHKSPTPAKVIAELVNIYYQDITRHLQNHIKIDVWLPLGAGLYFTANRLPGKIFLLLGYIWVAVLISLIGIEVKHYRRIN